MFYQANLLYFDINTHSGSSCHLVLLRIKIPNNDCLILFCLHVFEYMYIYKRVITHELAVSVNTVKNWYRFCRNFYLKILLARNGKIGGVGMIIEIDISKFGKRKCNQCQRLCQQVFNGIYHDLEECFLPMVENRSSETLMKIMNNKIQPGRTIYKNCWKLYNFWIMKDFPPHYQLFHFF